MTPPVFAHGNLRLYLLALLEERPRHGYELIQALSERFGGTYSPSAGTIYPRLSKLEEEGLVTKSTDGRKTVYEITAAGSAELDSRRHELDAIEDDLTDSVRRLADSVRAEVNDAMRSLRAELASAAREAKQAATSTSATGGGAAHERERRLQPRGARGRHRAQRVPPAAAHRPAHPGPPRAGVVRVDRAAEVAARRGARRRARDARRRASSALTAPTSGPRARRGSVLRWEHDRRRTPPVVRRRPRPAAAGEHARAHGPARRRRERRAGDRPPRALPAPVARGHRLPVPHRDPGPPRGRGHRRLLASRRGRRARRSRPAGRSKRQYRGRGIAPAAVVAMLDIARAAGETLPVHAYPRVDNPASNAVCRKAGLHAPAARPTSRSRPATCCTRTTGSSSSAPARA